MKLFKRKPRVDPVMEAMSLYNAITMTRVQQGKQTPDVTAKEAYDAATHYLDTYCAMRSMESEINGR